MRAKYKRLHTEELDRLTAVKAEFSLLVKAMNAYKDAMLHRISSAIMNGKEEKGHTVDCGNTHQREIDRLRTASMRFATKVGGHADPEELNTAVTDAYNSTMERAENEAIL